MNLRLPGPWTSNAVNACSCHSGNVEWVDSADAALALLISRHVGVSTKIPPPTSRRRPAADRLVGGTTHDNYRDCHSR
jgi:hypothetical protein